MPRTPRVQYSGAIHHVTSRGASRATIFRTDRDYSVFLATLAGAIGSTRWQCLAYCLMPNHYHLLLETPEPNLSEGMHHLNGTYARRFNAEHDHTGHVFDSRFHTALVTRESHLFQTARYIVLNPVRAAIANRPEDWRWSSYRATSAITRSPSWLRSARLLALFGADVQSARHDYREFVRDGIDPWNRGTPPPRRRTHVRVSRADHHREPHLRVYPGGDRASPRCEPSDRVPHRAPGRVE
jgi:putative transposase